MKQAVMADLESILSLYHACAARSNSCWDDEYPNEEIARDDIEHGWLYLYGDGGAASLLPWDDLEEMDLGFIHPGKPCVLCRLCLSPARQGKGEGKALLAAVEQQARELGYEVMHLLVDANNPIARRLYDHAGYRAAKQTEMYGCLFTAMEKTL